MEKGKGIYTKMESLESQALRLNSENNRKQLHSVEKHLAKTWSVGVQYSDLSMHFVSINEIVEESVVNWMFVTP